MKLSAIAVAAVAAFAASQANAFTVHVACTPNTQWNGVKGTKSFHQVAATSSASTAVRSTDIIFDGKIVRVGHTLNNGTLIDRSTQYAPDDNSVDSVASTPRSTSSLATTLAACGPADATASK
jgi:hypothetical protein